MKKFIYIAVAVILITSLMPGVNYSAPAILSEITIESPEASPEMLAQAESVIARRLEAFGITAFETERHPQKPEIRIRFQEAVSPEAIVPLLTEAGRLEFCEVYTQAEVFQMLNKGEQRKAWTAWLPLNKTTDGAQAAIGMLDAEAVAPFGRFAASPEAARGLPAGLRFALGLTQSEEGRRELYALKYGANGQPLLTGSAVERSAAHYDESTATAGISLTFHEAGGALWAQATRDNMLRPIAMVFDGQVAFAPRVMAEITSGQAQVTGDFSAGQARLIAAMIQGGELPAGFVVKSVKQ